MAKWGPVPCTVTMTFVRPDLLFCRAMGKSGFHLRGGGGGWHKALVVGSVSLWRRLLASRP